MGRAWRRWLTHGLVALLLAACYVGLVYLVGRWAGGWLRPDNLLALAFLVLLAVLLVGPVHAALCRFVDRALRQEAVDFRQAVQDLDASLAQVIDLPDLSRLILERIAEAMGLDAASLYLFDPFSGTYQCYQGRGRPEAVATPAFAETDRFIQSLRVAHGPVPRFDGAGRVLDELDPEERARVAGLQAHLFLPLATQDRLVGFITLGPRRSRVGYAPEDRALLGALSDRAAVAIENARLFAERERRLTELAVLNEIGQAINSARSLDRTLTTIYHETGRLMDTTNFYIALYDPQKEEVSFPLYIAHGERVTMPGRRGGHGLTERVLNTRQPLLIAERVAEKVRDLGLDVPGTPVASWLGVPILRQDEAIGVIAIKSTTPGSPYDVEDLHILEAIANQAAIAIENARRYEVTDQALSRRLHEITVLSEFAHALATVALDPAHVAEQTLERAVETLSAQAGILVHYDQEQQTFVPLAQLYWPEDGPWQDSWHALLPELFAAVEPVIYSATGPEGRLPQVHGAAFHILCPLVREDTPLALLHLALPPEAAPDEARRQFMRYLADHAAIALENALLYRQQVLQGAALDRRARQLAEILNLSIAIRANMDLEQVLHFVVQAVRDTLEFRVALLCLVDEKEPGYLRCATAEGLAPESLREPQPDHVPLELYQRLLDAGVRTSHSYVLSPRDIEDWDEIRRGLATGTPLRALLDHPAGHAPCTVLTPLRGTTDRLLGILTVSRPADDRVPQHDTIEILEIIANQGAVAIENTRLYQARREAYETKGEFLSLVAHELQVPIGTLCGYADLLDKEIAHVDQNTLRGFVQVVRSNIARLEALVHDLLEVSQAEAGALQLERVLLDVSEVVLDSVAAIRPRIERKGLTCTVEAPLGLTPVLTDRDRLGQVVDNLLSNAFKYTPAPGTIAVSARMLRSLAELDGSAPSASTLRCPCILVTVQDTGIGMSRTEQKRVFTRYFRSDHPEVRQEAGTGLGLYLARLLVERLGGQVWLESEPGQGSRFFVALPLAEAPPGKDEAEYGR